MNVKYPILCIGISKDKSITTVYSGNAHHNSKGGRITYWFVLLSLQQLLDRNQLHLFKQQVFSFSNNQVQTCQDRRSALRDISPIIITASVPCFTFHSLHAAEEEEIRKRGYVLT